MRQEDTPPRSPLMEEEVDENDVVYIEDIDEVINAEYEEVEDIEEMEEDGEERNDASCIFSKHAGPLIKYLHQFL